MPPKGYNEDTCKIYDQWGNSYTYTRYTYTRQKREYESAEDYIERNIDLLDSYQYQSFIDNCPTSIFSEVMMILSDAEIDWTMGLSSDHIARIDKVLNYPF